MLNRTKIDDLSMTGHPYETAKLILAGIKTRKRKSKGLVEDGHTVSIHFISKKGINYINIDITEGEKNINMFIPEKIAIKQTHKIVDSNKR
jgi:hypothetical protein